MSRSPPTRTADGAVATDLAKAIEMMGEVRGEVGAGRSRAKAALDARCAAQPTSIRRGSRRSAIASAAHLARLARGGAAVRRRRRLSIPAESPRPPTPPTSKAKVLVCRRRGGDPLIRRPRSPPRDEMRKTKATGSRRLRRRRAQLHQPRAGGLGTRLRPSGRRPIALVERPCWRCPEGVRHRVIPTLRLIYSGLPLSQMRAYGHRS